MFPLDLDGTGRLLLALATLIGCTPASDDGAKSSPRTSQVVRTSPNSDVKGLSVGGPSNGSLENGVQLPTSSQYTRLHPPLLWGSSYAVASFTAALATFRERSAYTGPIYVTALSQKSGGTFPPHASHQSGRDIDLWLPPLLDANGAPRSAKKGWLRTSPPLDDVDWDASWALVEAFASTGAVETIFMDARAQERLHDAATRAGATEARLDEILQWPRDSTSAGGLIKHSAKEPGDLHVRIRCAAWEPDCSRRPTGRPIRG